MLETLEAYFASGGVTTATAARLHLSVRAVTYRLQRIGEVLGLDPTDPAHRFTLHAAVLGRPAARRVLTDQPGRTATLPDVGNLGGAKSSRSRPRSDGRVAGRDLRGTPTT